VNSIFRFIVLSVFLTTTYIVSQSFPDWFLFPEKYGEKYIAGYSIHGNDPVIDAERSYTAYHECIAIGKLELFSDPRHNIFLRNSDYYYNFSPEKLAETRGKLIPHDAFLISVLSDDIVVLFSPDSAFDHKVRWLNPDTMSAPAWLEKDYWEDGQYYYGVGRFTSRGNPNDAWRTAEERAIFSILTNKAITVHRIRRLEVDEQRGDDLTDITALRLRFRLRNIEILQRWPDKKDRVYYVLIRIPVKGLFSPDLKP
jgi:hypothetical protein